MGFVKKIRQHGGPIREVERQINLNFAEIITEAVIDFRVLMVSLYGTTQTQAATPILTRRTLTEISCNHETKDLAFVLWNPWVATRTQTGTDVVIPSRPCPLGPPVSPFLCTDRKR